MNLNKLQKLILNKNENPEKRKEAFEEYIKNLPDDYSAFLTKVCSCDSSILRFRARKYIDNPNFLKQKASSSDEDKPILKLDKIKSSKNLLTTVTEPPEKENSNSSSNKNLSNKTLSNKTLSNKTLSNKTLSNKTLSNKTLSKSSLHSLSGINIKIISKALFLFAILIAIYFVSRYLISLKNKFNKPIPIAVTNDIPNLPVTTPDIPKRLSYKKLFAKADENFKAQEFQYAREFIEEAIIAAKETSASAGEKENLYLLKARIELKEKKYLKAIRTLESCDRQNSLINLLRAKAYSGLNRPEKALDLTEIYLKHSPNDVEALISAYDYSILLNQTKKVKKYLTILEQNFKDNITAVIRIAEYDHQEKNFAHLIDITNQFASNSGKYPAIFYFRANAFKALKQTKKSIANFEIYLRMTKKTLDADSLYELATQCSSINNVNKAFYYYRQAAEKDGEILIKSDMGILDEARTRFETLFSLTPEDPHIISELGWIEYLSGNLERSKLLFKALENQAKAESHKTTAKEMLARLENINLEPMTASIPDISNSEQQAEEQQSEPEPQDEEQQPEQNRINTKSNNSSLAKNIDDQVIVIDAITPDQEISDKDLDQSDRHIENAITLFDNKEYSRALEEYETAIELNPYSKEAHLKAGKLCQNKLKEFEDALFFYKKYLSLQPDDQNVYISISEILIKEKKFEQALPWVNTAINKNLDSDNVPYCKNLRNLIKRKLNP